MPETQHMQDLFGTLSGIFTAIMIALLVAITLWAWSSRRREAFDAAARAPLEEDADMPKADRRESAP
ncbi:MAG TPA: cbb3-type cytochrome c oxidase subunit 3 [Steroidobacteraceae bacterium]|nr:cbb3-type cytochrome c oxidase subunit 3 [Steroidobacteraceae bacterium]